MDDAEQGMSTNTKLFKVSAPRLKISRLDIAEKHVTMFFAPLGF